MLVLPLDGNSTYRVNKSLKVDASCKYPVNIHAALACVLLFAKRLGMGLPHRCHFASDMQDHATSRRIHIIP